MKERASERERTYLVFQRYPLDYIVYVHITDGGISRIAKNTSSDSKSMHVINVTSGFSTHV